VAWCAVAAAGGRRRIVAAGRSSGRGGATWSAWEKAKGGAKAVGKLGGDAWSGAGVGESLGRRGMTACGDAAAGQRNKNRGWC
jgi:hypothetical protein